MIHLLVVDDDSQILDLVMAQLALTGHYYEVAGVSETASVDGAIEDLGGVDILLTDYSMPEKTGAELAAELQQRFPDLEVVIFSGVEYDHIRHEIAEWLFLPKPFTAKELGTILEQAEARVPNAAVAWAPPQPKADGFAGWINHLRLIDIVQMLLLSHGTGRLVIRTHDGEAGYIQMERGQITAASHREVEGAAAVASLFRLKSGEFSFLNGFISGENNIDVHWETLLMNVAVTNDELAARQFAEEMGNNH